MTVAATVFRGCPVKITRRAQETILEELFKTKQNLKKNGETKIYNTVSRGHGTGHQLQSLVPTVEHGGGSIMVLGCFAISGPGL